VFAIAAQQNQYKTYILSDDSAHSRVEIVPERGGILLQWRIQDQEIFYLDAERFTHPDLSVRGGIPILFPICGNLPDNTYTHNGQQYTLKQHGFARDLPWEVGDRITDDSASLTLLLNSNTQTHSSFPFEFQVAFTYQLVGNTLSLLQRYTNYSAEPMPFATGLHPYFAVTDKTQLEVAIAGSEYSDNVTKTTQPFSGSFDFEQAEIDAAFQNVTSQSATVIDRGRNLKLTLSYDTAYSTIVFWTVKGKDFYCLEPWTAPRNALNTGDRLLHVEPGTSLEISVSMTVDFL